MTKEELMDQRIKCMIEGTRAFEIHLPYVSPYEHKSGLEHAHRAWLDGWEQGAYDAKYGLVHVAGQMSGGVQHCVICEIILTDRRGAAYVVEPGSPSPVDNGWAEGPVTVVKSGCTTNYSAGATPRVPECRPS